MTTSIRGPAYLNKNIRRRQQQRILENYTQHLRNIRPITSNVQTFDIIQLNNRKKEMQVQNRLTQIQKSNRILLEKITGIMNKTSKQNYTINHNSVQSSRVNKSLNQGVRRKQMESIQIQNAKLLKRLQEKKPFYDTNKLNQDWKRQKKVIQSLSNFPLAIRDSKRRSKRKSALIPNIYKQNTIYKPIQLCRMRTIDGQNFLITLRLDHQKLKIVGDSKKQKLVKIIQIQRQQAIDFIQSQCNGKIEDIFQRLMYDNKQEVLYLVGKDVQLQRNSEDQKDSYAEDQYKALRSQKLMQNQKIIEEQMRNSRQFQKQQQQNEQNIDQDQNQNQYDNPEKKQNQQQQHQQNYQDKQQKQ